MCQSPAGSIPRSRSIIISTAGFCPSCCGNWSPDREIAAAGMNSKQFIVATAGHVDHGKSSLVKALTGIDPDRLPEEKARGITIDLGFAHLELPAPTGAAQPSAGTFHLGIVDVPGHEGFVKNMVAGAG